MKNKEIEELLNKLHKLPIDDEYQCEVGTEILELGEIKLLLSYIEQLENNRDKAIEYINEMSGYDVEDYIRQDLLLILKGDSDE